MFQYRGFLVRQTPKTPLQFVCLVGPAKEIVQWTHADSIEIDRGGIQRELTQARWKQIRKFFTAKDENVIPSSVIIAFDPEVQSVQSLADLKEDQKAYCLEHLDDKGLVRISFGKGVLESSYTIDGQHRLKGMSELDFDVDVPVSLFVSAPALERAFQFITINNKANKVPTDNIKACIANFDAIEADLKSRLTTASIRVGQFASTIDVFNENKDSPFYKCVDWVNNRSKDALRIVAPQAIENSVKVLEKTFRDYPDQDDDTVVDIMFTIWTTIKKQYGITLASIDQFKNLFKKPTIQAITEHIANSIEQRVVNTSEQIDISNSTFIEEVTKGYIAKIPEEFWKAEWALKGLDTQAGRKIILKDIANIKKSFNLSQGASGAEWRNNLELYREDGSEED
ncbi:DGQHR domain-containing protein [Bradyrhizobium sp. S3.2.6]|uniref:DGQHR domain-containing protein n=1 Tax=Bradyrhizobium sp. S3.2.6 TaxID=3156428 RepID=UPI00339AC614